MAFTPQTNIKLLKVPIEIDNKNQLTFKNKEEQFDYFNNLPYLEIDNCSYQRKDDIIRYPEHIDKLLEYNYCMYQNENYSNKWFYCFITNMKYSNEGMTEISIVTDVFQTWQFDLNFKESFIEREMINVADDVPGANLFPEGLETGEYIASGTAEFDELEPVWCVAYLGESLNNKPLGRGGYIVNGIASSVTFLICSDLDSYNSLMGILNESEESTHILTSFSLPKLAVQDFMNSDHELLDIPNIYCYIQGNVYNQSVITKELISLPNSIDGYAPKNKKVLTYPYIYLGFNPSSGTSKIFRYENFKDYTPKFNIVSEVNPNPTIFFIPQNYRNQNGNSLADLCSINGYPTLANRSDHFNSWIAQQSNIMSIQMEQEQKSYNVNQTSGLLNGLFSTFNNVSNKNVGGSIQSGLNVGANFVSNQINHEYYIKGQLAQIELQKMLPDTASLSDSNSTLLGYNLNDKNIFTRYNIKKQFAERIDKYFDMYGYMTNIRKLPNLKNRPNWNYIKTIGCNVIGNIPQEDMQTIKDMFDNGITLWHNPETFLDYSQNNR